MWFPGFSTNALYYQGWKVAFSSWCDHRVVIAERQKNPFQLVMVAWGEGWDKRFPNSS